MFYEIGGYIRNKYYDELNEYNAALRHAYLFKHTLEDMPLEIKETDLFCGWYGFENDDLKPSEVIPFRAVPVFTAEDCKFRDHFRDDLKMHIAFTFAHTCIDYGKVVEKGLKYYIELVENELAIYPDDETLKAMKISLEAVKIYSDRYKVLAEEQLKNAETEESKKRLKALVDAVSNVPLNPARNFLEAVQSVWIMHTAVPIAERGWGSISIGRIDQYLYPLYKKHIENGGTKEEAKNILKQLFLLLDSYGDGACAMNIGGLDADGNDMLNDLSLLLIEVEKEMALRAPIFAVRIHDNFPEDVFDSLIDFDLASFI